MKFCNGISEIVGLPDVAGHEADFFTGLRCPACRALYEEGKRLYNLKAEEREQKLRAYLDAHPEIEYRAARDGGFGA